MRTQRASSLIRMASPALLACALSIAPSTLWAAVSNDHDGDKTCSNQTLHGSYGLTIEGLVGVPGPGIPIRGVVLQTYDGNGHITQVDHVVIGGIPPPLAWTPGSGTYTVNPDCTGKATIIVPSSSSPPLVVYFVIVDDGKEIHQVVEGNAATATGRRVD